MLKRHYHSLDIDEEQGSTAIFLPGGKLQKTVLSKSKPSQENPYIQHTFHLVERWWPGLQRVNINGNNYLEY